MRISVKPTTYSNYRSYVAYYVVPIIGDRKLQDIAPETITRLYGHLLANGPRRGNSNQRMYEHWRTAVDAGRRPKLAEMAAIGGVTYAGANGRHSATWPAACRGSTAPASTPGPCTASTLR